MKQKIGVLVIDGILVSAVFGLKDIFDICNTYCRQNGEIEFETYFIGLKESLKLFGMSLSLHKITTQDRYDIIIVPPIIGQRELLINNFLKSWLIQSYHSKCIVSAACMGTSILAQTGLLDYKRATTHWLLEDMFQQKFPRVKLENEKILIDEGSLITAGGVTAYIDLALYLIEKEISPQCANKCASLLLVDRGRDSQRCYKDLSSLILVEDKAVKKLLIWMRKNLDKQLDIKVLAKKMKMEERSFVRHFKREVKRTPIKYLQNLRIEEAKSLLISSAHSFEQITYAVGFYNESSFRRLFKRETSLNPGEYRHKFKFNHQHCE